MEKKFTIGGGGGLVVGDGGANSRRKEGLKLVARVTFHFQPGSIFAVVIVSRARCAV